MEKQPEKSELYSKRGMSAWKRRNTLKTEQLQQGDPGLNGTGKKKKKKAPKCLQIKVQKLFWRAMELIFPIAPPRS